MSAGSEMNEMFVVEHDFDVDVFRCDVCEKLAVADDCTLIGEEIVCDECEEKLCFLCRNVLPENGRKTCIPCDNLYRSEMIRMETDDY